MTAFAIPLPGVPDWLQLGLLAGIGAAVLAAVVFVVGNRLFPSTPVRRPGDGGESRRRAAIRSYLRSLDEPFEEDHRIDDHDVAFFLPNHRVALTFDAKEYFRLSRDGVHTILVEHEMPVSHLGWRLPFETPEPEPTSNAATGRGRTHWNTGESASHRDWAFSALGLSPDASGEEVTAAYRERVKDAHPDHGGDVESFRRLREAYVEAKQRAS